MSLNDDIKKYFMISITPVVATQIASATKSTSDGEISFMESILGVGPKEEKKSPIDLALPEYNSAVVIPLICDIKAKLAKLEKEMYSKAGSKMAAQLEKALTQLESTDLDAVLEGAKVLCEILDFQNIESYRPYLTDKGDRILNLIAVQYHNFFFLYNQPEIDQDKRKTLLDKCMQIVDRIFSHCRVDMSESISRHTIQRLMFAMLPFLVRDIAARENKNITAGQLYYPFNKQNRSDWLEACSYQMGVKVAGLFCPCSKYAQPDSEPAVDLRNVATLVAAIVELLRKYTRVAQDKSTPVSAEVREHVSYCIKAFTGMLDIFLGKDSASYYGPNDCEKVVKKMELSAVLYEMYKLYELYSEIGNLSVFADTSALQLTRSFLLLVFKVHGDKAWSHFALIDKELAESGKSPYNVAIFECLSERGFVRSSLTSDEVARLSVIEACQAAETKIAQLVVATDLVVESEVIPERKSPEFDDPPSDGSFEHIEAIDAVPETLAPEAAAVAVSDPQAEAKKNNKDEILRQVQMMHEQMAKSQSMINELMSKLNMSDNNQTTSN